MRIRPRLTWTLLLTLTPALLVAQEDASRVVAGGGIQIPGWAGRIDAKEAASGLKLTDARLSKSGDTLKVITGPATTYWNPANTATGDYTVSATFREPRYMELNSHPHPYGIVIGGNKLGTDEESYLYCAAYGNGTFIVRGFGTGADGKPTPFQLNGARGGAHDAVRKAAGKGEPVEQTIAVSVKGGTVSCSINGTVVGTYERAAVVGAGRLTSTDGVYGIRFAHNTEGLVIGLTKR